MLNLFCALAFSAIILDILAVLAGVLSFRDRTPGAMRRNAQKIALTAKVVGLGATALMALFLVLEATTNQLLPQTELAVVFILISAVGCALSWWRPLMAGLVIILDFILLGSAFGVNEHYGTVILWLVSILPPLVFISGGLFLFSWWLSSRSLKQASP